MKQVVLRVDDEQEKWYFSIVDVCGVLTDSKDALTARKYWNKLKQRLKEEGNETVTNCHQLKMRAADGKMRLTIALNILAEASATEISKDRDPKGFNAQTQVATNRPKSIVRWAKGTKIELKI